MPRSYRNGGVMATQIQVRFVEELPPLARKQPTWAEAMGKLRDNPGKWARLRSYKNDTSAQASKWRLSVDHPGYEWAVRDNVLYGRYTR